MSSTLCRLEILHYPRREGEAIRLTGHFDATGITKLVELGVILSADLAQLAYMKDPYLGNTAY